MNQLSMKSTIIEREQNFIGKYLYAGKESNLNDNYRTKRCRAAGTTRKQHRDNKETTAQGGRRFKQVRREQTSDGILPTCATRGVTTWDSLFCNVKDDSSTWEIRPQLGVCSAKLSTCGPTGARNNKD
ncbi:hypothetical protein RRG08_023542 [Elysia crispata]|uniref:Uncharacterized protein n=1 Tax=Elysia crispata TaxID=231223 RepID=A0AAE1EE21_9GAST|nr:hypothetical protein RRG08_023542 [Elysia crispata]